MQSLSAVLQLTTLFFYTDWALHEGTTPGDLHVPGGCDSLGLLCPNCSYELDLGQHRRRLHYVRQLNPSPKQWVTNSIQHSNRSLYLPQWKGILLF